MAMSWEELETRPGWQGIRAIVDRDIRRAFADLPPPQIDPKGRPKGVQAIIGGAGGLFLLLFAGTFLVLPTNGFGDFLRFILFIPLFFASIALSLYLNRKKLLAWLLQAKVRYVARAKALDRVARHLGLSYVARPGGKHPALAWLSKQSWLPREASAAIAGLPASELTMVDAVTALREAGIMGREPIVIATDAQKQQIEDQYLQSLPVEDGFHGVRGGVAFDAFEWIERVEDDPDIYHLAIVLTLPRPVNGLVELRARNIGWLSHKDAPPLLRVDLASKAFDERFRLRSADQVEARTLFDPRVIERLLAIAHGQAFRAVARNRHLVFDVEGEDRFALLDANTGAWDDTTLRRGLTDLVETLELVDALATTFRTARPA